MNLSQYTIKAQEAIQSAQQLAYNNKDAAIETLHLLKAILLDKDSSTEFLLKANGALKTFDDEFVTVEHLLIAILQLSDSAAKILKDAGLTEKGLVAAIKELRKGEKVQSATQETQFQSLSKYAKT